MQEHYYKFWRELIRPKSFEIEKESLLVTDLRENLPHGQAS